MYSPSGDKATFKVNAFYLNYGGYEELIGKSFPGLGWELPYTSETHESDEFHQVILQRTFGGIHLKRVIELNKGDSPELRISTTVTNVLKKKLDVRLIIHPVMMINRKQSNQYVYSYLQQGSISKNNIRNGLENQVFGRWAIIDEKLNVGIASFFDPSQAKANLHVDHDQKSFNMELLMNEHALLPNKSITFSHRYRVIGDAAQLVKGLLKEE